MSAPGYQVAVLRVDYSDAHRHWWSVIPRVYRTSAEALDMAACYAGDRSRWVVQPVWGLS